MPDMNGFQGRGFQNGEYRNGKFREVDPQEAPGGNGGAPRGPRQRPKRSLPALSGKRILIIIAVIILAVLILGSFYNVSEQENAVVTMFGNVVRTDTAGLYFKVPVIQQVHMVDITTHGTGIGYSVGAGGQNITNAFDGIMITKDFNLINIDFYLEYKVSDPVAFLYNSEDPQLVLKNSAMSCIRATISDYNVDDVMTTAKGEIQLKIREKLAEELSSRNVGLQLVNIMIQDVEPPTQEVFNAFRSVESAKQQADTVINNANRYKNEKLPAAEAEADKIIQNAEAQKAARIAEAEGQVARFNKMFGEYKDFPLITKKRLFYETMESLLPDLNVVISDGSTQTFLPLDPINVSGGAAQ
jgi:membrane protease subunit HflK